MTLINKTKFLQEINCTSGPIAAEVNELIFYWHKWSDINIGSNWIDKNQINGLTRACIFWRHLAASESEGFRDSNNRKSFYKFLKEVIDGDKVVNLFGILCPSYKKGIDVAGFTDVPGNTTYRAFANIDVMSKNLDYLGIRNDKRMFFADISLERTDMFSNGDWEDFKRIIIMDSIIAKAHNMPYMTLTEFAPELSSIVGTDGKLVDIFSLDVSQKSLERSMWRDRQFYPKNFGWDIKSAEKRTLIHAHSYYWQGYFIRNKLQYPMMVYSAYDYEKAGLYNGKDGMLWPVIIFPKKDENNPPIATLSLWR